MGIAAGVAAAYEYAKPYIQNAINVHNAKSAAQQQYEYQLDLMAAQYAYNQKALRESPTNYRLGLTKAGYNPILPFASSGGSGMNAGTVTGGTAGMPNPSLINDSSNNVDNVVTAIKLDKELDNIDSSTNVNNATAGAQNARAALDAEMKNSELIKQRILNIDEQINDITRKMKEFDLSKQEERWELERKERLTGIKTALQNADSQSAMALASRVSATAQQTTAKAAVERNKIEAEGNKFRFIKENVKKGVNKVKSTVGYDWKTGQLYFKRGPFSRK